MSMASNAEYQWVYPNYLSSPVQVSTSTASARSAELDVGLYRLVVDTACYFKIGGSDVVAATSGDNLGHYMPPYGETEIYIGDGTNNYIAFITASGTGIAQLGLKFYPVS